MEAKKKLSPSDLSLVFVAVFQRNVTFFGSNFEVSNINWQNQEISFWVAHLFVVT